MQSGDPRHRHGFQGASPRPVCLGPDARGQVAVGQLHCPRWRRARAPQPPARERLPVPPAPEFSCHSWRRETWKGRDRPRKNPQVQEQAAPEAGSAGRQRQGEVSGEAWHGQAGLGAAWEGRNLACGPHLSAHTQMPGWAGDRGGAQGHGEGTWLRWSWRGQDSCGVSEGGSWGWLDQCRMGARFKDAQLFLRGARWGEGVLMLSLAFPGRTGVARRPLLPRRS